MNCIEYLKHVLIGKPLTVEISRTSKKSRNQERYWHMLIGIVADHTGDDPEILKMQFKYEWLPLRAVKTMSGKEYLIPPSTAGLTKEQYADLITRTLAIGHELNLVMPLASFYGMEGL